MRRWTPPYIEEGLIVQDNHGATSWYELGLTPDEMQGYSEWEGRVNQEIKRMASLAGYECQVIGCHRPFNVEQWKREVEILYTRPNPGAERLCDLAGERITELSEPKYEVYLGVSLTKRAERHLGLVGRIGQLVQPVERFMGLIDPRPPEEQLERWRKDALEITDHLETSGLTADVATAANLRWLCQRNFWRTTGVPHPADNHPSWGGESYDLFNGRLVNGDDHIRVVHAVDGVDSYVSFLTFAALPGRMEETGDVWLNWQRSLGFETELHLRYHVLNTREALGAIRRVTRSTLDQIRHDMEVQGAVVPADLTERAALAQAVEREIQAGRESLVWVWPFMAIAAPTLDEVHSRVAKAKAKARDLLRVKMTVPIGDQRRIFQESLPGWDFPELSRRAFRQEVPLRTLAASGYTDGTQTGNAGGVFLGFTSRERHAVILDPHHNNRNDGPTLIGVGGLPGYGKSATVGLAAGVWGRALRDSVMYVDPDGLNEKLEDWLETLMPGSVNRVDLASTERTVSLDPYRVMPKGQDAILATAILTEMLPPGQGTRVENAIVRSSGEVSDKRQRGAKDARLEMVLESLKKHPEREVQDAAHALESMAGSWQQAKCLFSGKDALDIKLYNHYTSLKFRGLQIPSRDIQRAQYIPQNRVAMAVMQGMIALSSQMLTVPGSKQIVYDDAIDFLQNPWARATLLLYSRRGRKYNTLLWVISHAFSDFLLDGRNSLLSEMGMALSARLEKPSEAREACEVFDVPDTPENIDVFRHLGPDRKRGRKPAYVELAIRDWGGNVDRFRPDHMNAEIHEALNTTPLADAPVDEIMEDLMEAAG